MVEHKTKRVRRRLDFIAETEIIDEEKGIIGIKLTLKPERYKWVENGKGRKFLFDKLDRAYIPEDEYKQFANKLAGLPMYFQPQEIENADDYVASRIPEIKKMIEYQVSKPTFEDKSEAFLESLERDKLGFAILVIDLADSTKLSQKMKAEDYAKLIKTFTYEISSIVPKFHGHVLKYTGDGLIAYFPEPSFITKCDLALDCGLTMRKLVYEGLNPVFKENDLEQINVRVGIDAGDAFVLVLGNPETKQHKDIIGEVVSIASKIQSLVDIGGVAVGDTMFRNLHTDWRLHFKEIDVGNKWPYKDENSNPYKVYSYG